VTPRENPMKPSMRPSLFVLIANSSLPRSQVAANAARVGASTRASLTSVHLPWSAR
jgi:hypothetical protein